MRTDREFLESMAQSDEFVDHDDNCGACFHMVVMAEVARELLAAHPEGLIKGGIDQWSELTRQRWEASKYFKLWQEEHAAGRDPHIAFNERGWEP